MGTKGEFEAVPCDAFLLLESRSEDNGSIGIFALHRPPEYGGRYIYERFKLEGDRAATHFTVWAKRSPIMRNNRSV